MAPLVSKSEEDNVVRYIRDQEHHHRKRDFKEEYLAFLEKYEIEYDERYLWGLIVSTLRASMK